MSRVRLSPPVVVVSLLLLLIAVLVGLLVAQQVSDSNADSQAEAYQGSGQGETVTARSGPVVLTYEVSRSTEDGISVQTLLETRGRLVNAQTGQPVAGTVFRVEAIDLESGGPVFTTEASSADGTFVWDVDFWDGIPYDVQVTALPGTSGLSFDPVSAKTQLEVTPLSPPLGRKFVVLLYLLIPLLVGIGVGLLLARQRWGRPRPASASPAPPVDSAQARPT